MEPYNARYDELLRKLIAERRFSYLKFDEALEFFCNTITEALGVERVGIWELNATETELKAVVQWSASDGVAQSKFVLGAGQADKYLQSIKGNIQLSFDDAMNDPRCSELAQSYIPKYGITSMLDCPINDINRMIGVLCIEHVGPKRSWTKEEQNFAGSIASLIALAFENRERIKAEAETSRQTKRLQFYRNLVSDWQWQTDVNHDVIEVLGHDLDIGRDYQEVWNRPIWELDWITPVDTTWDDLKANFDKRQKLDSIIISMKLGGGEIIYSELSGRPIFDENDKFSGYWGVAKNITEKLQRENELQSILKIHSNAARLAKVGSWVWDEVKGRITYCSPELADIYGITPEELIERTVAFNLPEDTVRDPGVPPYEKDLSWVHPDDREHYRKVVERAHQMATGYETVTRIVRDDGSIRVLHELAEPVFSDDGRFVATTGVLIDMTDTETRKNELKRSREQLANLMDNIPGALYRVKNDENWTPIYKSAGFDELFGFKSPGDEGPAAARLEYQNVLRDADMENVKEKVAQAIKNGSPYEFEYPVFREGATEPVWLFERGRPILNADGEYELEGVLIDVTEKHAAQEALIQSQRMDAVGQLTGGIAHDFNNLLAVVLGNLELLRDELHDPLHTDFVDTAITATLRGSDLTKKMLNFAQQARLEPAALDLNENILGVQSWINRTLPQNISIRTKLSPDLWEIMVDHSSTESLILNLILNARDAMPQGGDLTIETANKTIDADIIEAPNETLLHGDYVVLSVSDTGHGIPRDILDRIFEPFFTTKATGRGTGLGLAMIRGFIKQSGGTVHVYSEQDIGTTFKIYFRASKHEPAPNLLKAQPETKDALTGVKILLAEDDIQVAKVIAMILERLGSSVTLAANGDEALKIFQTDPDFSLLLTDIVMPGELMGTHLAKALRDIRRDLPVIFMSGYADEAMVHGNGLRPEDIKLSKPVSRADLVQSIQEVLKLGGVT